MYELCVVRIPEKVRVSFERLYLLCAFGVIEIVLLLPVRSRSPVVPPWVVLSCMGSCRFDLRFDSRRSAMHGRHRRQTCPHDTRRT